MAGNIGKLRGILSKMKFESKPNYLTRIKKYGNSGLFNYATHPSFDRSTLQRKSLKVWDSIIASANTCPYSMLPLNGFDEMILLTDQGKLWRYPIDNEQGLDEEQKVPFEDHVFFDDHMHGFPKDENIQSFMSLITMGLARNGYTTVERKREIISFYRNYFKEHGESYKRAGLNLN